MKPPRRHHLNVVLAALLTALLLTACLPGSSGGDEVFIGPIPLFRAVTEEEAARALEFAELEFLFASPEERQANLSPLAGFITPSYRHAIPGLKFRDTGSAVTEDASYRQLYYWNLQPLTFDRLRPGDLIFYSDGSGPITGAGLFAGWQERGRVFRVLIEAGDGGGVTYLKWDLEQLQAQRRMVAAGRLFIAAAPQQF